MAAPEFELLVALAAVLGAVGLLLAILLYRRSRELRAVRDLSERLSAVAHTGDLRERLVERAADGTAVEVAQSADRLLERLRQETDSLAEREVILRRLLESMHEALAVDRDGIVIANARFAELFGAEGPAALAGHRLPELVDVDYAGLVAEQLRRHRAGEAAVPRLEAELRSAEGPARRVEFSFTPASYEGRPALLVTALEMTPRIEQGGSPRRAAAAAWSALDSLPEGVMTTDLDGHIVYVNPSAATIAGITPEEALGRTLPDALRLEDEAERKALGDPVRQSLATGARVDLGRRALAVSSGADGERFIELSVSPLRSPTGEMTGTVVAVRDVSDLRGLARQMSYQATHDALTGLVNRREFERRLQEAIEVAHSGSARHVLCYLDLDRFKAVNDECGHLAGDGLLRELAGIIKESVRDSDTVGRLGGDEFGMLLIGCPLDKARQIADDVARAVGSYRFVWKDKIFNVGVSVGLVEVSRESGSIEDLMHAADSACYVAKKQGSQVQVYSARDEADARQRGEIHWLQQLQGALKENRFELYAQPIVPVIGSAGGLTDGPGLEVLLRLKDDNGTPISPTEFMRAAERYRLMPHVDRWVVQTALAALGRGGVRLTPGRSLCINLSGQTLGDASFLEFVVDTLDRTGVTPEQLCFEVTENSVITNIDLARRFIGVLHGMGCHFALDDFGRGLSSFGNLKNLSLDYLKIDGSFIRNLASDNVNQAMVTAMIKLARSLNFRIVAEQVEDSGALDAVKRMGVDFVQGFEIGRPQPLAIAA